MRKIIKILGAVCVVVILLAAAAAGWSWRQLRGSIPIYDGQVRVAGLTAPVTIQRDALGSVTIRSETEEDEVTALGFVHAQERFFQMDLGRRTGAGELAELLGSRAVAADERARAHLFRDRAERAAAELPQDARRLLEAYATGVNAGLAALEAKPFEYILLRAEPKPWQVTDYLLGAGALYFALQDATALRKRHEFVAREILPPQVADLLYPSSTAWDAPVSGKPGPSATIPGADVVDLRGQDVPSRTNVVLLPPSLGSNNWAVAGSHTADGRALVANDMHMPLSAPGMWLRVSLQRDGRRVTGLTAAGGPTVVAGSNGDIAWGLTNSGGDWTELIVLELDPRDPDRYRTPWGWQEFEHIATRINVAGEAPRDVTIRRTVWGPVLGTLPDGTPYAVHSTAEAPQPNVDVRGVASARNVEEAIRSAQRTGGLLSLNFVVGDAEGHIGWTILGRIPRRVRKGAVSYSGDGSAWKGWLEAEEYPQILDPPGGRIWTANGRVVDGEMAEKIGNSGYALGARAGQIRDRLMAIEEATPKDMLRVQLDDEALFLARWRGALLALLDEARDPIHTAVREAVRGWGGHASVDSVGYRLVWEWRLALTLRTLNALAAKVIAADPSWRYTEFLRSEHWSWPLVSREPPHFVPGKFKSWREYKLDTLDQVLQRLDVTTPEDLAKHTWGARNTVFVRHPLSRGVPALSRWLDMPPRQLPGHTFMPRVQQPGTGATERFAVSPGDEENGYLHIPGGPSGHPLSPYYGAGHNDWEEGRATPFLPGTPESTLTLLPAKRQP